MFRREKTAESYVRFDAFRRFADTIRACMTAAYRVRQSRQRSFVRDLRIWNDRTYGV